MPHIITHKLSKGNAAHGRHEIRALEDVGRTTGGIQYRSQTGAQAELVLPTATDFTLGHDGTHPTWVSATQVATATQPVLSYLYTVTASASQILISWASVATQYGSIEIEFENFRTATPAFIASRFSTDGSTLDTATNRTFWSVHVFSGVLNTIYGSTATNTASQAMMLGTDDRLSGISGAHGSMKVFHNPLSAAELPSMQWVLDYMSTEGVVHTKYNSRGSAHYWPGGSLGGVGLFVAFGAASFTAGDARVYGRALV